MLNKVLFDHTIFLHQKNGGVSKYIYDIKKKIEMTLKSKSLQKKKLKKAIKELKCINGQNVLKKT